MAIVFALASALAYGVSDFLGGIFARRVSAWSLAVVGQASSGVVILAAVPFFSAAPTAADWRWGFLAGTGAGIGAAFLYRGLSSGRMSVVAPISGVGSALVPVAVGLASGERPSALVWFGICCAFPAIYLISRVSDQIDIARSVHMSGVIDGVLAGLGFGLLFAVIGQLSAEAGLAPLALAQVSAVLAVIVTAVILRKPWLPRTRHAWWGVVMGPLGGLATVLFLLATQRGLLAIVSVIAALYPAGTVVLAATVLRERIHRSQAVGIGLAAMAVALVAAG